MEPSKTAGYTFNGGHVGGQAIYESVNPSLSGGGRRKRRTVRKAKRSAKRTARRSAKRTARRSAKRTARRSAKRTVRRSAKRTTRRKNRKRIQGRRAVYRGGAGWLKRLRGKFNKKSHAQPEPEPEPEPEKELVTTSKYPKLEDISIETINAMSKKDARRYALSPFPPFEGFPDGAGIPKEMVGKILKTQKPHIFLKEAIIKQKEGCLDEYPVKDTKGCNDKPNANGHTTFPAKPCYPGENQGAPRNPDGTLKPCTPNPKKGGSRSSLLSSKSRSSSNTSSGKSSTKKRRSLGRLLRHTMKYGLRSKLAAKKLENEKKMKSDERKAHLKRVRANASKRE